MSVHSQTKKDIETILQKEFSPTHLEVIDDSAAHAGHSEALLHPKAGHFRVNMTSESFSGKNLVARHRMVYEKLDELMDSRIHALSLNLKSEND